MDEQIVTEVDRKLQFDYDKVHVLRHIFVNAKERAVQIVGEQLRDFKVKRTAGLGTMFGPNEQQLLEAKGDRSKEQRIVDETLTQKFIYNLDELEREAPLESAKKRALVNALATTLVRIFPTKGNLSGWLDKCSQFCSREKMLKGRLMSKNRKTSVRGHHFVLHQYFEVTHCNHCQEVMWGIAPQGYQCNNCELNIHRACTKALEESCPGPIVQKQGDNKLSKIMDMIRTGQIQSELSPTDLCIDAAN